MSERTQASVDETLQAGLTGLIRLAWSAATGFRPALVRVIALGVVVALFESATLLALFSFVGKLLPAGGPHPGATGPALNALARHLTVEQEGFLVLLLATVRFSLSLVLEWQMSRLWVAMRSSMQQQMLALHLNAEHLYLLSHKLGDHLYHVLEAPGYAAMLYLYLARYLTNITVIAVIFATLLAVSWELMIAAAVVAVVFGVFVRHVGTRITLEAGREQANAIRNQNQLITEGISGIRYLRLFAHTDQWLADFARESGRAQSAMGRSGFWTIVPTRTLEYLVLAIFVGAVLFMMRQEQDFIAAVPTLTVYFLGVIRLLPSLVMLGTGRMQMMHVLPNLEVYAHLHGRIPQETSHGGRTDVPDLRSVPLRCEALTVAYGERKVLDALTCAFLPGRINAIVGASGHGKSTLLDVFLRLIEPQGGQVRVGEAALGDFDTGAWRARIAYLGQEAFLFHASVTDNIRAGNAGATRDEVQAAGHLAGLDTVVSRLDAGWDTVLADRGMSLSGGQRQRIALARALLRGAQLLLLDEPTSALDAESRSEVIATLLALRGDATLVIVTHSEEVLRVADTIVVVEDGRVAEQGTFAQLSHSMRLRRVFGDTQAPARHAQSGT